MSDIDELWEGFLESASNHHIPADVLQERATQERQQREELKRLINDLELVPVQPVLGGELCDFLCDLWENGI